MNKNEKVQFVLDLCQTLSGEIIKKIESGAIPEEWDGFELRQLLSDHAGTFKMDKKRKREYDNTVIVNNL